MLVASILAQDWNAEFAQIVVNRPAHYFDRLTAD